MLVLYEGFIRFIEKEVISMMGTCKGCGTENVELNEEGLCAMCAGSAAPSTEGTPEAGTPEGTM